MERIFISPCRFACPLMRPIQRHNILLGQLAKGIKAGDDETIFLKLYDEWFNFNPLLGICGYICGICEDACNRLKVDEGVRIRFIERFIFDWYKETVTAGKISPYRPFDIVQKEKKVAIIGSGPAGLTAGFFLAKEGYKVTIFEAKKRAGGALHFIPSFRLPEKVVNFVVDQIITPLNIQLELNARVTIEDLKKEYDAVVVATGTPLPRPVPPFAQGFEEVKSAIEILSQISEGTIDKEKYQGKQVMVIGGSGVAIDAARSLRRIGAEVSLACLESEDRTSKDGILANVEDERCGKEEGITFYYSRGLQKVEKENSKLKLTFVKCTSVYDLKDGRKIFNPQFDTNEAISLDTDYLVFAIGQIPDREFLKSILDEKGRINADPATLATSVKGVFVAGDVFRIGRAADAIRAGKEVAYSVKQFLEGKMFEREKKDYVIVELPTALDKIPKKPAQYPGFLPVEERLKGFSLEQRGLNLDEVINETSRCLHCDYCENCEACVALGFRKEIAKMYVIDENCDGCGYCVDVCVYRALKLIEYMKNGEIKKTVEINSIFCRGCGNCQATCPKEGCAIPGFSLKELKVELEKRLYVQ